MAEDTSDVASGQATAAPVTRTMLLWTAVGVVVLAFVAAFLGALLARGVGDGGSVAAATPTATADADDPGDEDDSDDDSADDEIVEAEVLPAGSDVRAGSGTPSNAYGADGDVFIDITTANLYFFRDGGWTAVGNLRTAAVDHLTGAQGKQGEQGKQGAQGKQGKPGEPGEPGADGTQVVLGSESPGEDDPCEVDGSIFVNTATTGFYLCTDGVWVAA
ncbi:collagen-like triple helix repeat-containing protein [Agromyces larvae]|uniref:Collagen-like protein n=1 Tax=Agromyces larvae TaxID=2929802 RepID=A0ABY4BWA2_9MICO|nr:collagen-like protein [Agromyces larvae]UOE43470.1 collagen-like protein [Agromyces larvae]